MRDPREKYTAMHHHEHPPPRLIRASVSAAVPLHGLARERAAPGEMRPVLLLRVRQVSSPAGGIQQFIQQKTDNLETLRVSYVGVVGRDLGSFWK